MSTEEKITIPELDFMTGILENVPAQIAVIDRDLNVVYINRTKVYEREQLIGTSIFNILSVEDQSQVRDSFLAVFEGKGETTINTWTHPMGQNALFRARISPFHFRDKILYAVAHFENITEEYYKDIELKKKQAELSAIFNNTNDIILSIDTQFNILEFNDALAEKVRQGHKRELKKGDSVFSTFYDVDVKKMTGIYNRVLKGEHITVVEQFPVSNNRTWYFETSHHPIFSDNKITGISIFSRNISELKENEETLRKTLAEKELLLSEIHHRVKNNLAGISSIIQLHALNSENPEALQVFQSAESRLKTTALVHELLYENESLAHIDFNNYLHRLANEITGSFKKPKQNIDLEINCPAIQLTIEQSIPCGLLINEFLTNAFKHGLRNRPEGKICINVVQSDDKIISISVSNNGDPLPDTFTPEELNTTGMFIITTLVMQLGGELKFSTGKETCFTVIFKHD